ncbi:MAG: Clp protease ClpP [Pirellula sp.]|jgi:ATP-dependent protease ClpP protease subunit|nr:Clp protease ClpP [Pirellula sp.]
MIQIHKPIGQAPGEFSAAMFRSQLPKNGEPLIVSFHSEGGSLFEAFAIFDMIKAYRGRKVAKVEAMAFSAASMLLCAFDSVEVSPNAYVMLHNPHFEGESVDDSQKRLLAQLRDRMVGIYADKTRRPRSFIERELDREVFYDAQASIGLGIANRIAPATLGVVARLPQRIVARIRSSDVSAKARWNTEVKARIAAGKNGIDAVRAVDREFPGLRLQMLAEVNKR